MTQHNELLDIVREDWQFLRDEVNEEVTDESLRRSSPILRRLLVDGELQRAWKAAGFKKEPWVDASTLILTLAIVPANNISFAAAGGARYKGIELRAPLKLDYAISKQKKEAFRRQGVPRERYHLRAFVKSPCLVLKGQVVSRRLLVKYIANKLGGTHFDMNRNNKPEDELYALMDEARHQIQLLEKPVIYFEFLSIVQAITKSRDIRKLYS